MRQMFRRLLPGLLAAVLLVGCGQNAAPAASSGSASGTQSAAESVSGSASSSSESPAYVDITPLEETPFSQIRSRIWGGIPLPVS